MLQRKLICKQKGLVLSCTGTQQLPHLALSLYWIYSNKILCMSACAPFFIFGLSSQAHVRLQPQTSWQQVSQRLCSLHIPRVPEATGLRALCCLQRPVRVAELRKPSPAPMQLPAHGSVTTRTGLCDWWPSATHTYNLLRCRVCTFHRIFIYFKEEEARKMNEVSPGRGDSGRSMYFMIIKDTETSSLPSRAPAGSTCCNNKLCSRSLGLNILYTKYKSTNWTTKCLQPYQWFRVTSQFTDVRWHEPGVFVLCALSSSVC